MMEIVLIIIAVFIGLAAGYGINIYISKKKESDAGLTSSRIIEEARKEASNIIADTNLEAKEIIFAAKSQSDTEAKERLKEVSAAEKRIHQREEMFDNKLALLDKRELEVKKGEQSLSDRSRYVEKMKAEVENLHKEHIEKLEQISGMDSKQAKKELMDSLESETRSLKAFETDIRRG
jgi:ribonuclease Y